MSDARTVLLDLHSEGEELDQLVGGLPPGDWKQATPAPGWTISHQIAHLAWTDEQALLAVNEPDAFAREAEKAMAAPDTFVSDGAEALAAHPPAELLLLWREGRKELVETLADLPEGTRIPWYGPPMSVASMASARLMETWAHGQDVADALEVARPPSARLWHIARLGTRTRDYAHLAHGIRPPDEEFRVELTAPDGELWTFGPDDATQRVTGRALDFCLLVTQRAHRADLALRAEGADAERWLDIAQAFAGPPGQGREPSGGAA